ncbi:hypothetical protein HDU85_006943 [Gaertneriomyces sp. JEL0708]|nr:hypothetical protein HDU85_006943 [Gaertneriomyces sp. JEL0708]
MKLIGLTGSIATGKSTVSKYLSSHGYPVIDADLVAREVVAPGETGYYNVLSAFGSEVLDDQGGIDRTKLGSMVFANPEARKQINRATHPVIRLEMLRQILKAFLCGYPVCFLDIPLLYEVGWQKFLNAVAVVPPDVQKARLMARDGFTEEEADARIKSQVSIDEKRARADIIIENSGSQQATLEQVDEILARISPNRWKNWLLYGLLAAPAAVTYGILVGYQLCLKWTARFGMQRKVHQE